MSSSAHFHRSELPLSLRHHLRGFKTRFPHGGPGVESYLKQEPYTEWTPFFVHIIGCVLQEMTRNRWLQDNQEQLVLTYSPEAVSICRDCLLLMVVSNRLIISGIALCWLSKSVTNRLFSGTQRYIES